MLTSRFDAAPTRHETVDVCDVTTDNDRKCYVLFSDVTDARSKMEKMETIESEVSSSQSPKLDADSPTDKVRSRLLYCH